MSERCPHRRGRCRRSYRQQGVAVITALLLTTLAVTIVASLFWQQQVQVRSMENQRLQLQTKWILRGALDWARLILREDARLTKVDTLDEPWAVPLADTRLDEYVEKGSDLGDQNDAVLSGQIVDAQSRYNLANLVKNRVIDKKEVTVFARLLTNLHLKPELAQATAEAIQQGQAPQAPQAPQAAQAAQANQDTQGNQSSQSANAASQTGAASGTGNASANTSTGQADSGKPKVVALSQIDDLLVVPGMTAEILAALKDYVIVLPEPTPVNANTASAEVLAARVDGLSLADATARIRERDRATFKDRPDLISRLHLPSNVGEPAQTELDVKTGYFIVYGNVRLGRASQEMYALVERKSGGARVIWIREN